MLTLSSSCIWYTPEAETFDHYPAFAGDDLIADGPFTRIYFDEDLPF